MKKYGSSILILSGLLLSSIVGILLQIIFHIFNIFPSPNLAAGSVYLAFVFLFFIILIVEIISSVKIDDSTIHTALLALSLICLYLFSTDMQLYLEYFDIHMDDRILGALSELSFIFVVLISGWYIHYLYPIKFPKNSKSYILLLLVIYYACYLITLYFNFGYIVHFVFVIAADIFFLFILMKIQRTNTIGLTTYLSYAVLCFSMGVSNVNTFTYNDEFEPVLGISLTYIILSFLMFVLVYLMFSIRTDDKAQKSNEYQLQAKSFETRALTNQIKPHFIFNSLETIRELYHQDVSSGDNALNLLASFLRGSINSFDHELIPFETEINNIYSYTEFKNLNKDAPYDVIFNIDYDDFLVPPFSIQPFIENAIKYSEVNLKEGGYIMISSYKNEENIIIEIKDNGKGFDINKISSTSAGIKNACERFRLEFGTNPIIQSVINEGTTILIKINLGKMEELKNENTRRR